MYHDSLFQTATKKESKEAKKGDKRKVLSKKLRQIIELEQEIADKSVVIVI